MAVGYHNRHGFTISTAKSRKRMGKNVTQTDFKKMVEQYEKTYNDGDESDEDFYL